MTSSNTISRLPRWTLSVQCWLLSVVLGLLSAGPLHAATKDTYQNPLDVIIADPFILRANNTYYLYGTTVANYGLEVFSSSNLIDWRGRGFVLHRTPDSWAKNKFWAPECFEHHGKYYLHYTASGEARSLRICLAVANTPLGPFTDVKSPWLDPGQAVIDSHVFKDTDGQLYLYYVLDCSENKFSEVRVCKLSDDLVPSKESWFCARPSQPWEGTVWNEGPFVIKHRDTYYLTYSANAYSDSHYGLGVATAPTPLGPWTKSPSNPVLQKTDTAPGPGHNAVIASPDGKELFLVYHTLQNPGYNAARQLAMDRMHFVAAPNPSSPDVLVVDGPTTTDQPFPSGSAAVVRGRNDEFSSPTLDRKAWTVFGEEPQHYTLKDGHLTIQTADGDVAEKRDDAENLFLQYAPRGDFDVTTHVNIHPAENYENAFLCIWQDHDNFLKLASVHDQRPRLEVAAETAGHYDSHLFENTLGDDLYLRIARRGDRYSFYASSDDTHWTTLSADVRSGLGDLRVGVGAASPGTRATTRASFDFVRFTPVSQEPAKLPR